MLLVEQNAATTVSPTVETAQTAKSSLRGMSYAEGAAAVSPLVAERKAKASQLAAAMKAAIKASSGAKKYVAQTTFILDILPDSVVSQLETQVPASITIAQASLETGYGRSVPPGNNFFGIKGTGPAGSTLQNTTEEVGGQLINTQDKFRKYNDRSESFVDHARLLSENPRYAKAMEKKEDPDAMATEIKKAGYATDSGYPGKLQWIMATFGLKEVDPLVRQAATLAITPDEALVAFGRAASGSGGQTQTPTSSPATTSTPSTTSSTATSSSSSSSASGGSYVVKPGDTLSAIAQRVLGSASRYTEIARLNGLANPNLIRAGQTLKLPAGAASQATAAPSTSTTTTHYTVRAGDTLSKIARELLGDASRYPEIVKLNRLTDPNRIQVGQRLAIPG
ncbi:MAG: LysM peptidoglycan-binding domain-containing protein [Deltaproteobacteria bacterium]|nr:MAG: LysM peptidoglycan-binding domain-containing protein [Deltaproteobacteria bacterium]